MGDQPESSPTSPSTQLTIPSHHSYNCMRSPIRKCVLLSIGRYGLLKEDLGLHRPIIHLALALALALVLALALALAPALALASALAPAWPYPLAQPSPTPIIGPHLPIIHPPPELVERESSQELGAPPKLDMRAFLWAPARADGPVHPENRSGLRFRCRVRVGARVSGKQGSKGQWVYIRSE